ncbi:helix-hairpin-helix domain-containing protein, partial [Candidatus Hodarchaeum mangrovi]
EQEERSSDYQLPSVTRKEQTIEDIQLLILAAIPGININKAHRLLEKFGSLLEIANATLDELASVPSIGKKLANRIKKVFISSSKEKLSL